MKKLTIIVFMLFSAFSVSAQNLFNESTKFLGIPIDGTKKEMARKLEAKGYEYNSFLDCYEGEFNGTDVRISIQTNNNKVWRIAIVDAQPSNETNIKIRFNNLCRQFEKNKKYMSSNLVSGESQCLSDDEDISYGITVKNKRYEAVYYQQPESQLDTTAVEQWAKKVLLDKYTEEQLNNPTEELQQEIMMTGLSAMFEEISKRSVWFMIATERGGYVIYMFYENGINQANGEDL